MKKILSILIALLITSQTGFAVSYLNKQLKGSKKAEHYNSVEKHLKDNTITKTNEDKIKDPKLIKLSSFSKVNEAEYKKKLAEDEKIYTTQTKKALKPESYVGVSQPKEVDLYNLYRIAERIIRANNLEYINWRIELSKKTENFNAYTTESNLINIYSSLYDSLYGNDDALAFIISHELSHQVLGHLQRKRYLQRTLRRWIPEGEAGMLDHIYYKKLRDLEFEADAEGIQLLTKAGYDPQKAMDAINFMNTLPESYYGTLEDTHPNPRQRRESLIEIIKYMDPDLKEEGKANIYNSNVLTCKRSSDKVSFVIVADEKAKSSAYNIETYNQRLLRYAYMSYLNGENEQAIKYFNKLFKEENKYEYYLYISYAYENLYNKTKKESYYKKALENANLALELSKDNKYVKEQLKDLENSL